MSALSFCIVVGVITFFALLFYLAVRSVRAHDASRRQVAQALGFAPEEPDAALQAGITGLYQTARGDKQFELRFVSRKPVLDGEMYLFDLLETSGEDDSYTEQQAVAIRSPALNLPHFILYPKVDEDKSLLGGMANKVIAWGLKFYGTPVDLPEYPELQEKYIVTAPDPQPVRRFFDDRLASTLAGIDLAQMHAGGELFTFSQMQVPIKEPDVANVARTIELAQALSRVLKK
jgi:hypothetical protein